MKIPIPAFVRMYRLLSLILIAILFFVYLFSRPYFQPDDRVPVSLIGVQHLGGDYLIETFYIDKSVGDNVGESGGGGSMVCCLTLPRDWNPTLKADVRWEVRHIIRSTDPTIPKRTKLVGIYHAQVPVEPYLSAGDFYVHFFSEGRVRIVASEINAGSEKHPIRWSDENAAKDATRGMPVKSLFTAEELFEFERETERDRKRYGDWR